MRYLGNRSGRLAPLEERCKLKINVETAIIHIMEEIRPQMEHFFKENWKQGFSDQEFQEIVYHASAINFKKYSAVEFLMYSCRVCLLASFAFDKERKAPRISAQYISEVLQKYRLQKQFRDKDWTFMNGVLFHYLIDNNILP
ncbi:hypothetical protein AVEN_101950-1 [Araneus ventricosus]|uniref:Uncharacterized protein n=1 Tax=Araneus ventricosus TaxID=182803 RepID=A0A4Y2VCW9_ARAVE|nr:hypothetical protein AVEN_101950-1 [Araneus ventricosus]